MDENKRNELLRAFEDLRVCDVRDGLDALGYHHYGSLEPGIRPLYRTKTVKEGDFIVIDQSNADVGLIGSENSLMLKNSGMKGLVTNGGIRDTDEIILQKIPCWSKMISQPMVQGRLAYDAMDCPVAVGGVQIRSGDMIVTVADYAYEEHESDKKNRRSHYKKAGLELDDTVK